MKEEITLEQLQKSRTEDNLENRWDLIFIIHCLCKQGAIKSISLGINIQLDTVGGNISTTKIIIKKWQVTVT